MLILCCEDARKTPHEELILRCEDERFEIDIVLESNVSAIKALEMVQRKINRMSSEEKPKVRLGDSVNSATFSKAIKRIYGDKATNILHGLKRNPVVAVPVVLKRLRFKDFQWKEALKSFNKEWRDEIAAFDSRPNQI